MNHDLWVLFTSQGSWRSLGFVESLCHVVECAPLALVNGRIHWPAHGADHYFTVGFDLVSELILKMDMPDIVEINDGSELRLSISRDGKSIALFDRFYSRIDFGNSYVDVWEMSVQVTQQLVTFDENTCFRESCAPFPFQAVVLGRIS